MPENHNLESDVKKAGFLQSGFWLSKRNLLTGAIVSGCIAGLCVLFIILFAVGAFAGSAEKYTIVLDKTECELNAVGQTVSVTASLQPENSLVDIYFTSSNEDVLKVDQTGRGEALKSGVAAIEAKADIGGQTISSSCVVVVQLDGSADSQSIQSKPADLPSGPNCPDIPDPVIDEEGFLSSDNLTEYRLYNADTVAWLYVPGTNINLPVAQSEQSDPEFYLSHGLNKYLKYSGSAFLEAKSAIKTSGKITDQQTVIYGHARDTDIFDQLEHRTILQSWYNNKENRYIYLNTMLEKTVWEVFACYYTDISDPTVSSALSTLNFTDTPEELAQKYTQQQIAQATVQGTLLDLMKNDEKCAQVATSWRDRVLTSGRYASFSRLADRTYDDITINSGDRILTLISCADTNSSVRYVVQAKLVQSKTIE